VAVSGSGAQSRRWAACSTSGWRAEVMQRAAHLCSGHPAVLELEVAADGLCPPKRAQLGLERAHDQGHVRALLPGASQCAGIACAMDTCMPMLSGLRRPSVRARGHAAVHPSPCARHHPRQQTPGPGRHLSTCYYWEHMAAAGGGSDTRICAGSALISPPTCLSTLKWSPGTLMTSRSSHSSLQHTPWGRVGE
jgi:hypothetical protein